MFCLFFLFNFFLFFEGMSALDGGLSVFGSGGADTGLGWGMVSFIYHTASVYICPEVTRKPRRVMSLVALLRQRVIKRARVFQSFQSL